MVFLFTELHPEYSAQIVTSITVTDNGQYRWWSSWPITVLIMTSPLTCANYSHKPATDVVTKNIWLCDIVYLCVYVCVYVLMYVWFIEYNSTILGLIMFVQRWENHKHMYIRINNFYKAVYKFYPYIWVYKYR